MNKEVMRGGSWTGCGSVTGTQSTNDMADSEDIKRRHWQK